MADRGWKQRERRIARLLGTERIPVTGVRAGADCETAMFAYQVKSRHGQPRYLREWLAGIKLTGSRAGQIGVVVWQEPRRPDRDALVVLTLADWVDLHGALRPSEPAGGEADL
jgi:hypothetical protein